MIVDRGGAALAPIHFLDLILDREHPIDGRLKSPRHFRLDHLGEAAVAAEQTIGGGLLLDRDDVAELHILALACGTPQPARASRECALPATRRASAF